MSEQPIVIVDYGLGNLASIKNMIKKVGGQSLISGKEADIASATKLILPGVGHFSKGMENIEKSGLRAILDQRVLKDKIPVLGICLGMQLMTQHSEEGNVDGLGWIDAQTVKFKFEDPSVKIPHMGWNDVHFTTGSPEAAMYKETPRFYFVHSYRVQCNNPEDVLGQTDYFGNYHCSFRHENITGFQFHPEKSHKFGMQFFKSFIGE